MNREVCEHFNPVDLPCAKCAEASGRRKGLSRAADDLRTLVRLLGDLPTRKA